MINNYSEKKAVSKNINTEENNAGRRLHRFFIVGAIAALSYFSLNYLLQTAISFGVFLSSSIAYIIVFFLAYLGQKNWTFRSSLPHRIVLARYFSLQILCAFSTATLTYLASRFGDLSPFLSSVLAMLVASFFSFIISSGWVFSDS